MTTSRHGISRGARLFSWRGGLLGACLLLVTACSSTTLVYNRLDTILPWYLGRYVDLTRSQSRAFDVGLEVILDWHRREELPRYVDFLDSVEQDLESPFTVATLESYADRAEEAWFRIRDPGLEQLLELGASLSDKQIRDFMKVMEKKQRKYERKYLDRDDEEMRDDAFENLEETLEDYLGRLNDAQSDRLRVAADELLRSDEVWLGERRAWMAALDRELEREPGWQQRVTTIVRDWEDNLDPDVQALYDRNRSIVLWAIVDVVNTRSEKQDERLRKKIADFKEDFELLISQAKASEQGQELLRNDALLRPLWIPRQELFGMIKTKALTSASAYFESFTAPGSG
ncbi:DUF6279 family lipoprotein [Congregibacter litoralis]|uniref:Lipoprotein n=1 Tax=Congregibacter litoralis KT71 TaxID=314285 RepID=A4A8Z7_9GAMM|nr:DUF6279 family lipoprotein [Congregibacter litoralis]EAQ97539.2 hypothetical protein KT71_04500 [Congregibacter litoralis KT71]